MKVQCIVSVKKRNFSRNYLSVPATLLCDFLGKDGIASVFLYKFLSPVMKEFTHVKGSLSGFRHLYQIKKQWNCKRKNITKVGTHLKKDRDVNITFLKKWKICQVTWFFFKFHFISWLLVGTSYVLPHFCFILIMIAPKKRIHQNLSLHLRNHFPTAISPSADFKPVSFGRHEIPVCVTSW